MLFHYFPAQQTPAISVICPTRGRVEMLDNLCQSIHSTTLDKSAIEVLIASDTDDLPTKEFMAQLKRRYRWLRPYERPRGDSISRDYHNWLYSFCLGQFIVVINDDCEFRTAGWDQIILHKTHNYLLDKQDGVVYGWISDTIPSKFHFSCFPLVSRPAVNVLGYVMSNDYPGWGADAHLHEVYRHTGRILDLSEVIVYHNSPHLGVRDDDETNRNMRAITGGIKSPDVHGDVRRLLSYMSTRCPKLHA